MTIDAKLVKDLREKTGAGMMDCKKALVDSNGDLNKAIDNLNIDVDFLLIDGNKFEPYMNNNSEIIPHLCIVKGDDKYTPICCASILAKVYHDEYIEKICDEEPELNIYDWKSNMCYGTQTHIEAIKKNGLTKYHRRTFGICKDYI